jgi:HEPN domain-containing protein
LATRSLDFADVRTETEPWWRQAQADLETAEFNLRGGHFYAASWLSQQAAEKGVKALWVDRLGEAAPRTHDLRRLGGQLGVPQDVRRDLDNVTQAFDLSGYPDTLRGAPVDTVTSSDATDHLDAAQRILAWVAKELQTTPS